MSAASWQTIAELLEMNASRFGSRAALFAADGEMITHEELFRRAEDVAAWLGEMGIRNGDRVAIALSQGVELATILLGVSAAGVVAVPLDLQEAHRGLLERLEPALLIADTGAVCRGAAEELGIRMVGLRDFGLSFGEHSKAGPNGGAERVNRAAPLPDDVAFVLHTSGTSAAAKRVPLTHANVCASAGRIAAALELGAEDSCLIAMPLFHGHGLVATLLPALAAGGSCVCLPGFDAAEIAGRFAAGGVTWFTGVPAMYRALVEHVAEPMREGSLRFLRTASAAMPAALMEEIEKTFGVPLIQAYGMTEAAGIASNPLPPRGRKPGSAGLAVGVEVAILDEDGRAVTARDVVGYVAIRGPIVTAGYEDDAVANKVFRDGWFHTGDRGRVDGDGYLFLMGRGGDVINRGGEKIGAAEIDEVLAGHPAIREAAAFGAPHASLGEDLAAAVSLRSGTHCTEQEVRDYLLARLPAGKVPSRIVFVDELPRNTLGKVQRNLLAASVDLSVPAPDEDAKPWTERETQVATIFAKVLGRNGRDGRAGGDGAIGREANFFSLGGDSLSAVRAIAGLERVCNRKLSAGDLLRHPTVREMAEALDDTAESTGLIAIRSGGKRPPLFFCYGDLMPGLNFCRDLPQAFDEDQPIYVVAAPAERDYPRTRSLEATARELAEMIAAAAPSGPLILSGYCYGGMIASEVARQLRDAGREIPLLVILDSFPSSAPSVRTVRSIAERICKMMPGGAARERRVFQKMATILNRTVFWRRLSAADKIDFFRKKLMEKFDARRRRSLNGSVEAEVAPQREHAIALPLRDAVKAFQWEMAGYKPRPYAGRIALFVSEEYRGRERDCGGAWRALGAEVTEEAVPGNHGGCVTSHREFLLEKLRVCFATERG